MGERGARDAAEAVPFAPKTAALHIVMSLQSITLPGVWAIGSDDAA
jgi:hypothetical protein